MRTIWTRKRVSPQEPNLTPKLNQILEETLSYVAINRFKSSKLNSERIFQILEPTKSIPNLYGNSIRTSIYLARIIQFLKLRDGDISPFLAALFHDLGKLDDMELYRKVGWTKEDIEARKRHPGNSRKRILQISPHLITAANIAYVHHAIGDKYPENAKVSPKELFYGTLIGLADCKDASDTRPYLATANPHNVDTKELLEERFGEFKFALPRTNHKAGIDYSGKELINMFYQAGIFTEDKTEVPFSQGIFSKKFA